MGGAGLYPQSSPAPDANRGSASSLVFFQEYFATKQIRAESHSGSHLVLGEYQGQDAGAVNLRGRPRLNAPVCKAALVLSSWKVDAN
jgi:hypothetical protein